MVQDNRSLRRKPLLGLRDHRWLHFLLIACVMSGAAQLLHQSGWIWSDYLDDLVLDLSFNLRGSQNPSVVAEKLPATKDIIMIEMAHEVPRPILSKLLALLRQAKVVAFDVMFVNHEAELKEDEKLWYADSLQSWHREVEDLAGRFKQVGNVVIGMWPERERVEDPRRPGGYLEQRIWQKPPTTLWNAARCRAHLWVTTDIRDGIIRRVPVFERTPEKTPCLGLAIAATVLGISQEQLNHLSTEKGFLTLGSRRIPIAADGTLTIDYVGTRKCFEYDSNRIVYEKVLQMCAPEDFKDKIVIIGETDFKSKDILPTPFGDMPGMQIQGNIVATLLSSQGPPRIAPVWWSLLFALFCSLLLVLPLLRLPLWSCFLVALGQLVLVVLAIAGVFCWFHEIGVASVPMFAIVLTYNSIALYEYSRTRFTLGRFIGHEMVSETMDRFSQLNLGGQIEEASAFFCDLRGYSTLSEFLSPKEVTSILNDYTSTVVNVVKGHQGRPIDYLGDGVFVLFEQRRAGDDYALKAVKAAVETQRVFAEHRERWIAEGAPVLQMGIAIHTGSMVIGVLGSEEHLKLGAVGDVINVAARVQELSKECGYDVLITSDTYEHVKHKIPAVFCGSFNVKGREQPVEVYGVRVEVL